MESANPNLRFLAVLVGAVVSALPACAGQLDVSALANIFGAGHLTAPGPAGSGGGILPASSAMSDAGYLTFAVSGQVSYNGMNYYGPDGGQYLGAHTAMDSYGGISGIRHDSRTFFLVGAFLGDQEPAGSAPSVLDFTADGFAEVSPALDQTFYIGDGVTGTGAGVSQKFYVPAGTTRMFLGFADGIDFTGLPGSYGDNVGTLNVSFTQAVPEPSSLLLLGFVAVAASLRWKWEA